MPLRDNHASGIAQLRAAASITRQRGVAATQRHFSVFSNLVAPIARD
jgi:hypothetical protein